MQHDKKKLEIADDILSALSTLFALSSIVLMMAAGIAVGSIFNIIWLFMVSLLVGIISLPYMSALSELGGFDKSKDVWTSYYVPRRLLQKSILPLLAVATGLILILLLSNPVTTGLAIGLLICAGLHLATSLAHLYVEKQLHDPNSDTNKPVTQTANPRGDNVFKDFYRKSQEFFLRFGKTVPVGASINDQGPAFESKKRFSFW